MSLLESVKYLDKKFLIVGGTGFIGANMVAELVKQGSKVHVFHRKESKMHRLQHVKHSAIFSQVDFANQEEIKGLIGEIDPHYVVNFAQPSYFALTDTHSFAHQMGETTSLLSNLLNALNEVGSSLEAFIQGCSSTIYQWTMADYLLSETTPKLPSTYRGLIKLNERNICLYYAKKYGLPIRIARIFRAYGPWDHDYKLVVKVLKNIQAKEVIQIGQDTFKRDYIYVEDLIEGILKLTDANLEAGLEVNFGSGLQYSASEIVTFIEKIIGEEVEKSYTYLPNPYDKGNYIADITLAKTLLGWKPQHAIIQGLTKTIAWYKDTQK
ncbi:hypothetical protein BKI52_45250 [marine bacterium AO1-C]|nr:hypothetical protein BKI52_45250 [marine bacterium AO1-C]